MNEHERRRRRMREVVAQCDLVLWDIAQEELDDRQGCSSLFEPPRDPQGSGPPGE